MNKDLLTRYALYREDPERQPRDDATLSTAQIRAIEMMIDKDAAVGEFVEEVRKEFRALNQHFENEGFGKVTTDGERPTPRLVNTNSPARWRPGNRLKAFTRVMTLSAAFLLLASSAYVWTMRHPFADLARIERPPLDYGVRNVASSEIVAAIEAYQHGRWQGAIASFQQIARRTSEPDTKTFGHYYAGLSYLLNAQKKFLGITYDFDSSLIDLAISHLTTASEISTNVRYLEDIHWYLAKAKLMLQDRQGCITHLQRAASYKGKRLVDAKALMASIAGR